MSFLDNMARKIAEKQVEMEERRAQVRAEREAREAQETAIRQARVAEVVARQTAESVGNASEPSQGNGFCGHCGAPIREGALFCYKCGTKVPQQNPDAEVPEESPEYLEPLENPEEEVKEAPDTPRGDENIAEVE